MREPRACVTRLSPYLAESSLGVPGAGHYQPHLKMEEIEGKGSNLSKGTARGWGNRNGNQRAWLLNTPPAPYHRAPQNTPHSHCQEQKPARRVRTQSTKPDARVPVLALLSTGCAILGKLLHPLCLLTCNMKVITDHVVKSIVRN